MGNKLDERLGHNNSKIRHAMWIIVDSCNHGTKISSKLLEAWYRILSLVVVSHVPRLSDRGPNIDRAKWLVVRLSLATTFITVLVTVRFGSVLF
ncbi:hypothetical protein TNCV_2000921 [Trichonephila clavipes]|nr:hypothetical protein TNCV_2000921 [Trichonephila clavipes]